MTELLPCPFCGGKPAYPDYDAGDNDFVVVCGPCGATSRYSDEQDDVISAWNQRAVIAPPGQQTLASDALHDALSQAVGWIEECDSAYEGRQYVLTEARAALKGFRLITSSDGGGEMQTRGVPGPQSAPDQHAPLSGAGVAPGPSEAASPIQAEPLREALTDLSTHRDAWRRALQLAAAMAAPAGVDHDDAAYWAHELRAFDRTFAALSRPSAQSGQKIETVQVLAIDVDGNPSDIRWCKRNQGGRVMAKKSYWQAMSLYSDGDKAAAKSWFSPLCDDDMTPYKAEILCDVETDREKKLRVFMTDGAGKRFEFVRTNGAKNFSIAKKPLDNKVSIPSTVSNQEGGAA